MAIGAIALSCSVTMTQTKHKGFSDVLQNGISDCEMILSKYK